MTFEKIKEWVNSKSELPNLLDSIPEENEISPDFIENNEYIKARSSSLDKARRERLEQSTIFALFLPYTRMERTGEIIEHDDAFPREFREVKRYKTADALWDAYANTPCLGTQMIIALDEKDYEEQLALWNKRYDDEGWIKRNYYPRI